MSERVEVVPPARILASTPAVVDRVGKRGTSRGRGRPATTDTKVARKTPILHPPKEETKKKKGSYCLFEKFFFFLARFNSLNTSTLNSCVMISFLFVSRHEEG